MSPRVENFDTPPPPYICANPSKAGAKSDSFKNQQQKGELQEGENYDRK